MFKAVPLEIKNEILRKIKEGEKAPTLGKQYGISDKTIYSWLRSQIKPDVSLMDYNKLKRENDELKRMLGMIMLDLEQEKKRGVFKKKY
jgi:hypothetical protein